MNKTAIAVISGISGFVCGITTIGVILIIKNNMKLEQSVEKKNRKIRDLEFSIKELKMQLAKEEG